MDNEQENYRKKIYNDFYNDKLNIMELFVFLFSFNCTNKYDSEDYYKIQDDLDFLKKFYSDVKDNSKYDLNFIMHGPDSKIEYPPYVKDDLTEEEMDMLIGYEGRTVVLGVRPENVVPGGSINVEVISNENLGQNTLVNGVA